MRAIVGGCAALWLVGAAAAAAALSPQAAWKAGIEDANKDYSVAPHAILKIQDATYLHDGDSATLVGTRGKPDSYHWLAGDKAGVLVATVKNGHPSATMDGKMLSAAALAKGIDVDSGVDIEGAPTQVEAGVIGARFFVYNQQAKAAKDFKGLSYFPYDPAWRVTAAFTPDAKMPARVFQTSRGTSKQFYRVGTASFTAMGKRFALPFYGADNDPKKIDDMSAFFTDDLTGKGAYGSGRYVDVDSFGKFPPKTVTIDFNDAYNPNCARSAFFTCPVALDNLAIAVKAGERDPHAH